jgi:cold shock CspA family protein
MQAKIIFWHEAKQFGFAELDESRAEVFVGRSSLYGDVKLPLKIGTRIHINELRNPRREGDFKKAFGVTVEAPLYE